jgi:hypothetical protein
MVVVSHVQIFAGQRRVVGYFVRIHKTLRMTPAMAAGVSKRLWEIGDIVDALEAWEQSQTKVARHDAQETR